jgi:hypothetical protein
MIINPFSFGAGAPPFSPDDITGLILWLEADAITALSDGDPVTTWEDASGENNDASQATGSNKPLYQTNEINGLPAVQFVAASQTYLTTPSITTSAGLTAFIVYKHTSSDGYLVEFDGNGNGNAIIAGFTADVENYSIPRISMGSFSTSVFNLHAIVRDVGGPVCTAYKNGSQTATSGTTPQNAGGQFTIGATALGVSEWTDGWIAALLVYDSPLGTTDRQSVETYLNGKYALF